MNPILIPIVLPLAAAFVILLIAEKTRWMKETLSVLALAVSLLGAFLLLASALSGSRFGLDSAWLGQGIGFTLKADRLSSAVLLAVSLFTFLTAVYSFSFDRKGPAKWFYFNLLVTQAFAAGAVLSESLATLLFFWEGLPAALYAFIALSGPGQAAKKAAMKAFLINGAAGLCLLAGAGITACIAGTFSMTGIAAGRLTLTGWAWAGCALLLTGAVAKAGALPFHTWTTDAAADSSAPFMACVPAAVDKLLGIYFLARICAQLFTLNGTAQLVLMTLGALTLLAAVMMAFVQTDYRRMLSWLAVSQAGYMILGIGTLTPAGAAGGLFHMLNGAVCLSCLFMTAGSVERRAGACDLPSLGGLFSLMPVTGLCFLVCAAALSGIPPLNGYFSRELILAGTLNSGHMVFFLAAEAGAALTLASFLKLGHAVFFGKRPGALEQTTEAPASMLFPMLVLAALCAALGFGARLPAEFFLAPALGELGLALPEPLGGFSLNPLFWTSVAVVLAAVISHVFGCAAAQGRAGGASDYLQDAPILKDLYGLAGEGFFDPYEQFMKRLPGEGGRRRNTGPPSA